MENLDLKCAELGSGLAQVDGVREQTFTDVLSVLEEQGLYAAFLYLTAREGEVGRRVSDRCAAFLRELHLLEDGDLWKALQKLGEDLDRLLFARDLLRQALVYGRYHAKARQPAGGGSL
jgi:hypothetical protein